LHVARAITLSGVKGNLSQEGKCQLTARWKHKKVRTSVTRENAKRPLSRHKRSERKKKRRAVHSKRKFGGRGGKNKRRRKRDCEKTKTHGLVATT